METPMQIESRTICPTGIIPPVAVLVFKTSVNTTDQVDALRPLLDHTLGGGEWNFDLEDRDHILRVESGTVAGERITALLARYGHSCVELE